MEANVSIRYRVNVSTSVKGVKTWDCTVDCAGYSMEDILSESDKLVSELERRYPAEIVDDKPKVKTPNGA